MKADAGIVPTCPQCGAAELAATSYKTERVEIAITRLLDDCSFEFYDMGTARGDEDGPEYDSEELDEVFCNYCGHRLRWRDVYEQLPKPNP